MENAVAIDEEELRAMGAVGLEVGEEGEVDGDLAEGEIGGDVGLGDVEDVVVVVEGRKGGEGADGDTADCSHVVSGGGSDVEASDDVESIEGLGVEVNLHASGWSGSGRTRFSSSTLEARVVCCSIHSGGMALVSMDALHKQIGR